MPLDAFLLALAAAALHAGWNILVARAEDVRAATTVAVCLSVVLFAPVAVATWDVEAAAVPWLALSAALELAYFALLTAAYRTSDVSLVYPIARGVAPVLVLVGASLAGAILGALQAVGVVVVGAGVLLVRGARGHADRRGVLLALAIALTIAGYTLADNEGIEHASAIAYLELVLVPVAIIALVAYGATGRIASVRAESRAGVGRRRGRVVRGVRARPRGTRACACRIGGRGPGDERAVRRRARSGRAQRARDAGAGCSEPRSSWEASHSSRRPEREAVLAILLAPIFTGSAKWARGAHFS